MYNNLLKSISTKSLRYISIGWTRIHPYHNLIESHSLNAGKSSCSPADIMLEFGDELDIILRLRCECLNFNGSQCYRMRLDQIERRDMDQDSKASIQVGQIIDRIQFYETYSPDRIPKFDNEIYFPNGLLFEFKSGDFLGILGQEGDDQCEPCHFIKFIPFDEIEIFRIEWMKDWIIVKEIQLV